MPMTLAYLIAELLKSQQVLTIHQLEDGLMISLADTTEFDDKIIYIPEDILLSKAPIEEAVRTFHEHHIMERHIGFDA